MRRSAFDLARSASRVAVLAAVVMILVAVVVMMVAVAVTILRWFGSGGCCSAVAAVLGHEEGAVVVPGSYPGGRAAPAACAG